MSRILLVGSSIFEEWAIVRQASPGDTFVNRAVGGTVSAYWREHLEGIVSAERPDQVWYYCGSNDLNVNVPDDRIIANTKACRAVLTECLPKAPFVYFAIIKAPQKAGKWDQIDRINSAVQEDLLVGDRYIETNAVFWRDGKPVASFFREDELHITDEGYAALTDYVRQALYP